MSMDMYGYGDVLRCTYSTARWARKMDRTVFGTQHGATHGDMGTSTYRCVLSIALILCPGLARKIRWAFDQWRFHDPMIAVYSMQFMKSGKLVFLVVRVRV